MKRRQIGIKINKTEFVLPDRGYAKKTATQGRW